MVRSFGGIMRFDKKTLAKSQLYSEELGIDLSKADKEELFKWFLASILFGARISEKIARKTYKMFEKRGLLEPKKILEAGWDVLVFEVLDPGGYVRYDEKTATKILKICKKLIDEYGGDVYNIHVKAKSARDLEEKLMTFYGIGPVTANIFLRELRVAWKKSDPAPLEIVIKKAKHFNINLEKMKRKSMEFMRIEAGLIRMKKDGDP